MFFCSLLFQICQKLLKIFEQVNFFPLTIFAYNFPFLKKEDIVSVEPYFYIQNSSPLLSYSFTFTRPSSLNSFNPRNTNYFDCLLILQPHRTGGAYIIQAEEWKRDRTRVPRPVNKPRVLSSVTTYTVLFSPFFFFFFFLSLFFRVLFRDSSSTAIWSDRRSLLEEGTKVGGDRERKRGKRRVGGPHVLPLFPFFFNARAKGALLSRSHEKPPPLSWPPFCFSARGPDRSLALSSLSSDRSWLLKPLSPLAWRISILPLDACRMSPVY